MSISYDFLGFNDLALFILKENFKVSKPNLVYILEKYESYKEMELFCLQNKIDYKIIKNINDEDIVEIGDYLIVIGYPYKISNRIIEKYSNKVLNIHTSLLPNYKGYHPISWSLINGEHITGVTLHQINNNYDSGNIISQKQTNIYIEDDINTVRQKLKILSASILKEFLHSEVQFIKYKKTSTAKNLKDAPRRFEKDSRINWKLGSKELTNYIRALKFPYPNLFGFIRNTKYEITDIPVSNTPGKILKVLEDNLYVVSTKDSNICIKIKTNTQLKEGDVLE